MTPNTEKLVSLYAQYGIERIRKEPKLLENAFGKSLDELADDWMFPGERILVEDLQQRIESSRDKLATPDIKQQISECLLLLLNLSLFNRDEKTTRDLKLEILRALLAKRFAVGWSASQKTHFDFAFEKIKEWNLYFLSYTNDGAKTTNQVYKPVIDRYVPQEVFDRRDLQRENVLADAVMEGLRKRLLTRSFYDKQNIKAGDDLMAKIGPACGGSFAFVILVQMETFDVLKAPNWCFEEYTLFVAANQTTLAQAQEYKDVFAKRFTATLAGDKRDDVCPPYIPMEYQPWIDRIFVTQRYTALPRDPEKFEAKVKELADEILNVTFQIIKNVPA